MTAEEKTILTRKLTAALPVMRKSIELTQAQLSDRSGVARATISAIERGRQEMSWGTFVSLATVFRSYEKSAKLFGVYDIDVSQLGEALHQKRGPAGTGAYSSQLGDAPFSADILSKVNVGLWAIEYDAGQPPRMYVDDTMKRLVGISPDCRLSPEKTYSAWYDRVDPEHYEEVLAAIRKMMAGEHAEVLYPWHHPNGTECLIRCGGKRNDAYRKGVRIEGTHQNVSEVTHYQKAKLGTIELDQNILAKANIGLWAFELDEGCAPRMYVDDTMLHLIGLEEQVSPEETYHAWYDHIDPAHYDEVGASVEKMTAGVHAEVQYPWRHPNGSVWTVRCGGIRNYAYRKGIRIEGTHQNVSELVHFQKRTLADMLAALSDEFVSVYFLNPYTGVFESVSAGEAYEANDDRALSPSDFYQDVAEKIRRIIPVEDRALFDRMYGRENLIRVLESGKQSEFVVRWPGSKEGQYLYMKNEVVPYVDDRGEKKLVIGILDVTSEKLKEKELEEQLKTVEGLCQDYDHVFLIVLSENERDDRIVRFRMSETVLQSLMPGTEELDSVHALFELFMNQMVYSQDREEFFAATQRETILENLRNDKTYYVSFRVLIEGEIHHLRTKFAPIRNSEGKIEKLIAAFSNVDEAMRKQYEYQETLKNALEMAETANKAKSTFLFNMSHDIRTPMNAIIGFNNMAMTHIDEKERALDCLQKVQSSSRQLLALINDVLDMARIESGKARCEFSPLCITEAASELVDMIRETTLKNLRIRTDFSGVIHDYVLADRVHVNRILTNIISNSVKYTPEGGSVQYSIRENPTDKAGRFAYDFIVEDNGIGMSEEFLAHIFEEFTREKSTTLSGVQGTGLGMSITKRLVDLLGGTIQIESRLGEGTRVTIRLEMEEAVPESADSSGEDEANDLMVLAGRKVLLVEDNELNREIAVDILEEYGLVVETAENGEIAVEKCRNAIASGEKSYHDLILMDIQMPVMDGYEATRVIRSLMREGTTRVPIVAMTANAFEEDKKKAMDSGMNAHIAKPIDRKALEKVLLSFIKAE